MTLFENKLSTKVSKVPATFSDSGDKQSGELKASLTERAREAYDGFTAAEKSLLSYLKRALRTFLVDVKPEVVKQAP